MGCDIHLFIEYCTVRASDGEEFWFSFGNEIHIGRDYSLFSRLAGVRSGDSDPPPKYPPRGLPENVSHAAQQADEYYVTNEPEYCSGERCVNPETAECWVANGTSRYKGIGKSWVTDPDNHTHSWLTYHELWEVVGNPNTDMAAVMAAMRVFEDAGKPTRIVFWFDN